MMLELGQGRTLVCNNANGGQYQPHAINHVFELRCTITYKVDNTEGHLIVALCRDLHSPSDMQELFGNYHLNYWVRFALNKHKSLGIDSHIMQLVLWSHLSFMPKVDNGQQYLEECSFHAIQSIGCRLSVWLDSYK